MTPYQLRAARTLLLAHHQQADKTPRLHGRRDAYRTALACIEAVMAASEPVRPVRAPRLPIIMSRPDFAPTAEVPMQTRWSGVAVRGDTLLATLVSPL